MSNRGYKNVFKYPKNEYFGRLNEGSVSDYITDIYRFEAFCSCPSFLFRKKYCKHIKELFKEIGDELSYKVKVEKPAEKFDSSLEILNDLFQDSLYNSRQIVGVYGKPNIGKSLMATQEACYLASQGKNVLYIDTEGSAESMFDKWGDVFEERFGEGSGEIYIVTRLVLRDLLRFLGWDADVVYKTSSSEKSSKKKGKLEFRVIQRLKTSQLEECVKSDDIDFIILDSITSPLRRFTTEQQNFPARASCTAFILKELIGMQENYNVGVLVTNHASWNPAAMPHEKGIENVEVTGGVVVHHYLKRILYLDRRGTTAAKNYRRFWLVRGENFPEWSGVRIAKIDDEGYHDILDKKKISSMLTSHEVALLEG